MIRLLGILWSAPLGLRVVLLMLIPWWRGTWLPYMPRKVRVHNWTLHFVAGRLIPKGLGTRFQTYAQTHWFMIWFADEGKWQQADLVEHEERHTRQEWLFGPLYPLIYGGHFLVNLARYRDVTEAYRQIVFERDARRHAGQKI